MNLPIKDKSICQALEVFVKLMRAADSVAAGVHRELAGEQLTVSQFGVLEALYHLGPLYQKELADKILKSTGNLTLVIDNLEKRDLVRRQRNNVDRRYVQVALTEAGEALIARLFPDHAERIKRRIGVLDPQEQVCLAMLLRKLGLGRAVIDGDTIETDDKTNGTDPCNNRSRKDGSAQ